MITPAPTRTLRITKQTIIQALRKEPLTWGVWRAGEDDDTKCSVCAVGATLRVAGAPERDYPFNRAAQLLTAHEYGSNAIAPVGNWLSALSIVWEFLNAHSNDDAESLRPDILAWAEDHIPEGYVAKVEVPA